jgi:starch-binding outer membrane protein SusE/F
MKNVLKNIAIFSIAALVFSSCKKQENQVVFEGGTAPALVASSTAPLVLVRPNQDNQAIRFSWTNPNYKFNTGVSSQDVSYTLQLDTTGANFTNPKMGEKSISKDLSVNLTVKDLNNILSVMELKENIPHNLEFRIKSTMANGSAALFSNVIKVVVTPYFDVVYPVPTELYITGDATPLNWQCGCATDVGTTQKFTKVSASKFELTIVLNGSKSYLFLPKYGNWNSFVENNITYPGKYGFNGVGGNNANNVSGDDFKPEGNDMKAPASTGTYKITVDYKTGKFSVL